jgi:hypothetical protein
MNAQALSLNELRDFQGGVYYPTPPCNYPGPTPTWPTEPVGPIWPIKPIKPISGPIISPVITWQDS